MISETVKNRVNVTRRVETFSFAIPVKEFRTIAPIIEVKNGKNLYFQTI